MTPELQKEFDELNKYKEFVKLFFEVFELEYSLKTQILKLIPQYPYCLGSDDFSVFLIKEDADKILEVAKLLEQENGVEQEIDEDE